MEPKKNLPIVIVWLAVYITFLCIVANNLYNMTFTDKDLKLAFQCLLAGGTGGALYLLRALYLNYCVRNNWENRWALWYFVRPFTSMLCGIAAMVFLKAGLMVLNAEARQALSIIICKKERYKASSANDCIESFLDEL